MDKAVIDTNGIDGAYLKNLSVTNGKIQDSAVDSAKIENGTIQNGDLSTISYTLGSTINYSNTFSSFGTFVSLSELSLSLIHI